MYKKSVFILIFVICTSSIGYAENKYASILNNYKTEKSKPEQCHYIYDKRGHKTGVYKTNADGTISIYNTKGKYIVPAKSSKSQPIRRNKSDRYHTKKSTNRVDTRALQNLF